MARTKTNLLRAAEWLWSNRGNNLWCGRDVLTAANKDETAPRLTLVEAQSVFKILEERGLIFQAEDGRPVYHLHEAKVREWNDFLSELKRPENKDKSLNLSSDEEKKPDITEPWKFAWHHISKNCRHLRAAWIAVAALAVIAFLVGWLLAWNIVVASKDATIEKWRSAAEITEKDNEKLSRQNQELKSAITDSGTPLKKRSLILATQLIEFARHWKSKPDDVESYDEFEKRFTSRIEKAIGDFDEIGQHSDSLNKTFSSMRGVLPLQMDKVEAIAVELQLLAKKLSDEN